jgi:uncharacterized paraquat-inducible protein A
VSLLASHLADRDQPCPACGYNLRGCAQETCPECGAKLALTVESDRAHSPLRALRLLFLGLILWNGAGALPVAVVEMLRYWQAGSGMSGAGQLFVWYVVGEIAHAAIILLFAVLGLRSCRRGSAASTATYAMLVLIMQSLVAVYHLVMVLFI